MALFKYKNKQKKVGEENVDFHLIYTSKIHVHCGFCTKIFLVFIFIFSAAILKLLLSQKILWLFIVSYFTWHLIFFKTIFHKFFIFIIY